MRPEHPPRYEDLQVGQTFGPHRYDLTRPAMAEWCDLHRQPFPESLDPEVARRKGYRDAVAPAGMAFIFSLQAVTNLGLLRPGAILARHDLTFHEPPCAGDAVYTTVRVAEKYERRGRNYVVLEFLSRLHSPDGPLAVHNRMTAVWPD